ncbi:hypothetical protein SKAU_G00401630 [Synaphobranchus kaupii]|uniref:Uncharacterized protein n=1 Tax=Synaphobranchus kaupii TaxID=118154 RepID=A0A9Q1E972_SYNKA|nr:hypothetical protein SKAU_G00401630 [Synaphobranchus kaupii]
MSAASFAVSSAPSPELMAGNQELPTVPVAMPPRLTTHWVDRVTKDLHDLILCEGGRRPNPVLMAAREACWNSWRSGHCLGKVLLLNRSSAGLFLV